MNTVMKAVTTQAPTTSLAASCTLLDTDTLTISTQKLLLDGDDTFDNVTLHQHIAPAGGFCFIDVPAAHLFALDLDDSTITLFSM
ncbi:hypothetical protein [Vreelandella alkaliphila]|uniref:hypothetical protein n=1 Tax=Vreelandella alkaliphila TaxID=272774 RepID=UPI003FD79352